MTRPVISAGFLAEAAEAGDAATIARYLLAADPKTLPALCTGALFAAARKGDAGICRMLLAAGADPNAVKAGGDPQETALHVAVLRGHTEVCRVLLAFGARQYPRYIDGATPLHLAVWEGYGDIGEILIAHGADPNAPDSFGDTPLHYAAIRHFPELCIFLIKAGADPNRKGQGGLTALGHAVCGANDKESLEAVSVLLAMGADPNIADRNGDTPLHVAASGGHVGIFRELLLANASLAIPNRHGRTPMDIVQKKSALEKPALAAVIAEIEMTRAAKATITAIPTSAEPPL